MEYPYEIFCGDCNQHICWSMHYYNSYMQCDDCREVEKSKQTEDK